MKRFADATEQPVVVPVVVVPVAVEVRLVVPPVEGEERARFHPYHHASIPKKSET